jgi:hypothetical protein
MWRMSWKAAVLLSIVIPICLLTTFRLTGILPEPQTPETTTIGTVSWNISRPNDSLIIEESVSNHYTDNTFSSNMNIHVFSFYCNDGTFYYHDVLTFALEVETNTSEGFIHSIHVESSNIDEFSFLMFKGSLMQIELTNLVQRRIADGSYLHPALLEATSIDNPTECALSINPIWMLSDEKDIDQRLTITIAILYFDGTIYRKVNIPIQLGVMTL